MLCVGTYIKQIRQLVLGNDITFCMCIIGYILLKYN